MPPQIKEHELEEMSFIEEDKVLPLKEIVSQNKKQYDRFSTGFKDFDNAMNGGLKNGDLVIISGISGEGKTSYAQTMTYHLCKNAIPCLWFSYEVSLEHLDNKFKTMGISDFYEVYTPQKNTTGQLDWIKYKIKESWAKWGTKVVFIDHIDFLTPADIKSSDNEAIAYKKIATQLKSLAIELDMIIVCMAHLKKLPEDKEPGMQDIGYSAGIFHLADYVLMIWREKIKDKKLYSKEPTGYIATNRTIIKIVKNRETGILKFITCQYINNKFVQENYEEPINF